MKATQKDFATIAPRAARAARVFFLCGPDESSILDAADRLAGLIENPGERVELAGSDLKRDPVRLGDEARSTSLFGDARHIWVRTSGDETYDAVETLLGGEVPPCPVLILASNATDKSRIAKLLAPRDDALVAMFYPPDLSSVAAAVRDMAGRAGLRMGGDLAERIARSVGLDTRLAQSEVTKLALYLDAAPEHPRTADAEALAAVGASTDEDGFMPLVNAVLGGESRRIAPELRRLRELGLNPVGVLLAFERRVGQLAGLAAKLGPRGDIPALLAAEKAARRIFWKDERDIGAQLRQWRAARLERLAERLMALHRQLLANNQAAELLLAQELAEIARHATARR